MTQKELEVIFYIALAAKEDLKIRKMNNEQFAQWVSKQLYKNIGVASRAIGVSYISPCSEEAYWENQKLEY